MLKNLTVNFIGVYVSFTLLSGIVTYNGSLQTLFLASLVIAIGNILIRPLVNLLLLPIHLLTMGLFRWVSNLVILYLLILLVPSIRIHQFTFPGFESRLFIVPPLQFSYFAAFIYVVLVITLIFHFLYWLFQD